MTIKYLSFLKKSMFTCSLYSLIDEAPPAVLDHYSLVTERMWSPLSLRFHCRFSTLKSKVQRQRHTPSAPGDEAHVGLQGR